MGASVDSDAEVFVAGDLASDERFVYNLRPSGARMLS
jgi:hypothetical protein